MRKRFAHHVGRIQIHRRAFEHLDVVKMPCVVFGVGQLGAAIFGIGGCSIVFVVLRLDDGVKHQVGELDGLHMLGRQTCSFPVFLRSQLASARAAANVGEHRLKRLPLEVSLALARCQRFKILLVLAALLFSSTRSDKSCPESMEDRNSSSGVMSVPTAEAKSWPGSKTASSHTDEATSLQVSSMNATPLLSKPVGDTASTGIGDKCFDKHAPRKKQAVPSLRIMSPYLKKSHVKRTCHRKAYPIAATPAPRCRTPQCVKAAPNAAVRRQAPHSFPAGAPN